LINSADIKPNGRNVRCAVCNHEWFQAPNLDEKEILEPTITDNISKDESFKSNLPSTYIEEKKPSLVNSMMILIFVGIIILVYWLIQNKGIGFIVFFNYYANEFYFNLKLLIRDLAKIFYQIIN
tara:strand:- start:43 stop:414 length:372 start_codon:yes stop_codon:yes gene_type:complete